MSLSQSTASPDDSAVVVPISRILVADRFRKDLGDVSELAASIVEIGLLNPITVTSYHGGFRLVAGERRLTAFRSLGLTEIPCRVARDIVEARDLLVAERDENTQRKEMLPTEATALGMAIEEMERPAALERKRHGRPRAGELRVPGPEDIRPREIAAEAIGMSEATYRRIKQMTVTADDETEPESVREIARDALEQVDQGAPVRAQVERIKEAKVAVGVEVQRPNTRTGPKRQHLLTVGNVVNGLEGLCMALTPITSLDDSITSVEASRMAADLHKQIQVLRRIKTLLERKANA